MQVMPQTPNDCFAFSWPFNHTTSSFSSEVSATYQTPNATGGRWNLFVIQYQGTTDETIVATIFQAQVLLKIKSKSWCMLANVGVMVPNQMLECFLCISNSLIHQAHIKISNTMCMYPYLMTHQHSLCLFSSSTTGWSSAPQHRLNEGTVQQNTPNNWARWYIPGVMYGAHANFIYTFISIYIYIDMICIEGFRVYAYMHGVNGHE